jgi:hypothetical protein
VNVAARTEGVRGLRLRWDQVDFNGPVLHLRRVKNGTAASTHPIQGDELRAVRRLQREVRGMPEAERYTLVVRARSDLQHPSATKSELQTARTDLMVC